MQYVYIVNHKVNIQLNKSFRTVGLRTQVSIFTSSRENEGCQKIDNLFLHILTPHSLKFIDKWQRSGHFTACGFNFKNDTLLTGFTTIAAANTVCVLFMTAKFRSAVW